MAIVEIKFDVIIIGGGPAGMSAAAWCSELGLRTVLIEERREFGGQLLSIYNRIENYPGLSAATGREFRDRFLETIDRQSFNSRMGVRVASIDVHRKLVTLENGDVITGRALIIATGVRRRKLRVEGEEGFRGRGILESGAKEAETVAGKTVMVIGGGDAAIENALILSHFASKVIVVHRSTQFTARSEFLEKAQIDRKIEFITGVVIREFTGGKSLESVKLQHTADDSISSIAIDAAIVRIGFEPNSDLFHGSLKLDEGGYICINGMSATTVAGVFAAGDISNPISPTISTAAGTGAIAAKAVFALLIVQKSVP